MEIDPPNLENSNQVVSASDEKGSNHVRSYDCTFCKRGFSNAQALGGHMNIHRKDRVKLKQPSKDNKPSLDTTKKNPTYPLISFKYNILDLESSEDSKCTIKWPSMIPRENDVVGVKDNHVGEQRQLLLFIEMPSSSKDKKSGSLQSGCEEKRMDPSHGSSKELDLELRLGTEPYDTSTMTRYH